MDQFHLMQVFAAVGEQRSFAAAARLLDISPAAVTRAISTLESHLGVQLGCFYWLSPNTRGGMNANY